MKINDIKPGSVVVGVGVDTSQDGVQAVDWAARHAKNEGRDLVLLHAVGSSANFIEWSTSGGFEPTEILRAADVAGQAVLDTAAARVAPDLPEGRLQTVVARTDPRSALLEAARQASVLVVGSRGLGPVKSLLIGSVGAAVAAHSDTPVVVVRPHHRGTVRRGVLVGVDSAPTSQAVLEFAFQQAAEQALPLNVVHTVWDPATPVSEARELGPQDPAYADGALALAETLAGLAEKFPEVAVTKHIVRGIPAKALLALADSMHLVVVGHHRQTGVARMIEGSVALNVLEHARTAVAVVPHA